jgi:hypothetical protein
MSLFCAHVDYVIANSQAVLRVPSPQQRLEEILKPFEVN